jgi:hypothetical protein
MKHLSIYFGLLSEVGLEPTPSLEDQNLPPSPTAYFAATIPSASALEYFCAKAKPQPRGIWAHDQSPATDDEPVAAALCTFLSMVLPKVSQAVLISKWAATVDSLVKILKRNSVSAEAAKFGMKCISYLLTTGDKSNWIPVESAYGILLNYATDGGGAVTLLPGRCLQWRRL